MSDCCEIPGASIGKRETCPRCGARGKRVPLEAVQAHVTGDALRNGIPAAPRFCETRDCPVVYFDSGSEAIIEEPRVNLPVYAKHPDEDTVTVCHCFDFTRGAVRNRIESDPRSAVSKEIAAEVLAGHCACEIRNPKGSCCLGDVTRIERDTLEARQTKERGGIDAAKVPACHC